VAPTSESQQNGFSLIEIKQEKTAFDCPHSRKKHEPIGTHVFDASDVPTHHAFDTTSPFNYVCDSFPPRVAADKISRLANRMFAAVREQTV